LNDDSTIIIIIITIYLFVIKIELKMQAEWIQAVVHTPADKQNIVIFRENNNNRYKKSKWDKQRNIKRSN